MRLFALLFVASALFLAGCDDEACFVVNQQELDDHFAGSCPSQDDAIQFFQTAGSCSQGITKVTSDGDRDTDNDLCCYSVEKQSGQVFCEGDIPE